MLLVKIGLNWIWLDWK